MYASVTLNIKVSALQIHTLLENRSLLFKWEQWTIISTQLLEATVSSAWIVSAPKFLKPKCPFLIWRFRVKLRVCLVTICHENRKKELEEKQIPKFSIWKPNYFERIKPLITFEMYFLTASVVV